MYRQANLQETLAGREYMHHLLPLSVPTRLRSPFLSGS